MVRSSTNGQCEILWFSRSLKALNSELRQIKEQISAQEKEYGSRDHVMTEYRRRKKEFERANDEVLGSKSSLMVCHVQLKLLTSPCPKLLLLLFLENDSNEQAEKVVYCEV